MKVPLVLLLVVSLSMTALSGCLSGGPDSATNDLLPDTSLTGDPGNVHVSLTDDAVKATATGYEAELALVREPRPTGAVLSGRVTVSGATYDLAQTLSVVSEDGAVEQPLPYAPVVTDAKLDAPDGTLSTVFLRVSLVPNDAAANLRTLRGELRLSFHPDRVVYGYSFLQPVSMASSGLPGLPLVEWPAGTPHYALGIKSTLILTPSAQPAATGAILPDGTVKAGDDGASLDAFETFGAFERGGLFATSLDAPSVAVFRAEKHAVANRGPGGSLRVEAGAFKVESTFVTDRSTTASPLRGNLDEMGVADLLLFGAVGETPAALFDRFVQGTALVPKATDLGRDRPDASNVVVAIVDTGINPYHLDFRNAAMDQHPSTYITGYPAETPKIPLTFGHASVAAAIKADAGAWKAVEPKTLYWIPGTKIIGAYSADDQFNPPGSNPRFIFDNDGHGTGSASVSTGYVYGANPDALLVVVEGFSGLTWAIEQPWIDIVSNSWGPLGNIPVGGNANLPKARANGQVVLFAAGNGFTNHALIGDRDLTLTNPYTTPDVVTVGAVSPRNGQDYNWHAVPVDVASYGLHWPSSFVGCIDCQSYFGGTSCATPVTAGAVSLSLLRAREALHDTQEGWRGEGVIAEGQALASGPLSDGVLSREELVTALKKTAQPEPFEPEGFLDDPITVPTTPAYFLLIGYGIVNQASAHRAADVLLGLQPMPDRSDVDSYKMAEEQVRGAIASVL